MCVELGRGIWGGGGIVACPPLFSSPRVKSVYALWDSGVFRAGVPGAVEQIRIEDPDLYQSMVDAEWEIIYEKLQLCVDSGASIILSRLPIGDLATQYFADRDLFCAGRVAPDDVHRIARATGACVCAVCVPV
jgi:hypothetical protein